MAFNVTVTYGLLSFKAKLEGAIDKPPDMKNLCPGQPGKDAHEPSPLRQPKHCDHCGPVTDLNVIVKGIPQGDGYAIVSQEEVAEQKFEHVEQYKKHFEFVAHPAQEVLAQTAPGGSVNYLYPADVGGEGIYQMLLKLVSEHPEVALVSLYTPRSAASLYMLTARNGALVAESRTRSQALKPAPSVGGEVNDALYGMLEASTLAMMTPYNADDYEDTYRKAIAQLAEDRAQVATIGKTATPVRVDAEAVLREKLQAMMKGAA